MTWPRAAGCGTAGLGLWLACCEKSDLPTGVSCPAVSLRSPCVWWPGAAVPDWILHGPPSGSQWPILSVAGPGRSRAATLLGCDLSAWACVWHVQDGQRCVAITVALQCLYCPSILDIPQWAARASSVEPRAGSGVGAMDTRARPLVSASPPPACGSLSCCGHLCHLRDTSTPRGSCIPASPHEV